MYGRARVVFVVVVLALWLAGCATALTYTDIQDQLPPLTIDKARIFFYSEGPGDWRIKIDGQRVGRLGHESNSSSDDLWQFFFIELPPGVHEVVGTSGGLLIGDETRLRVTLSGGDIRYVKALFRSRGSSSLILLDKDSVPAGMYRYIYVGSKLKP